MLTKSCLECNEVRPIEDFYKNTSMTSGRVNKCKCCTKKGVTANRSLNIEHYREYDRARGNRQEDGYLKGWRAKYPNKYKAHGMVARAIRSRKLFKEPCEVCGGAEVHAHHDDYAKPLNVRWLCPAHHKEWHTKNGSAKNAF